LGTFCHQPSFWRQIALYFPHSNIGTEVCKVQSCGVA
jgi:hypothetical protein